MNRWITPTALSLAAFWLIPPAVAETVQLGAAKDNTLYQTTNGSLSNGQGEFLFAGRIAVNPGNRRRGLIAFGLDSIPQGSIIDSVTLTLRMSATVVGDRPVSLHRLLADWGEGASDAPDEEGAGGLSEPSDATWIHTFYNTQTWATPGGDFSANPSATVIVGNITGLYFDWSSPAMVADVQGWLDNPSSNFGWAIVGDESLFPSAKRFDSSENANPDHRPVLTISYTIPAPGGLALLASAFFGPRRRRDSRRA